MRKQREEKRQEEETASEGAGRSTQDRVMGFDDIICFYTEVTSQNSPILLFVNYKDYTSLA